MSLVCLSGNKSHKQSAREQGDRDKEQTGLFLEGLNARLGRFPLSERYGISTEVTEHGPRMINRQCVSVTRF